MNKPKTIVCDIDGVLLRHNNKGLSNQILGNPKPLDGTIEKLTEWDSKGYKIILITGRRESDRDTAYAINLYRNEGIENVKI